MSSEAFNKKNILILNTNIGYGGASKMLVFVANYLSERGHLVTFLTYRDSEEKQILAPGVFHEHIPMEEKKHTSPVVLMKTVLKLHKYLKKRKFDLAVAFLSPSQLRLGFASIGTKTKLLFSERSDPTYKGEKKKSLIKVLNRVAFNKADYYVFQTEGARSCFGRRIQNHSVVIPNPIFNVFNSECVFSRKNKIVNVARLDIKQKRQDLLISAFNKFCIHNNSYTLDFYGDGPDEQQLKELADGNERIIFHGAISNVMEEISSAAMFVLSSDFEGIPNALLEAMSVGVPCISTDCSPGGAALLIHNEENGLLVPCGDTDAICNAMKRYADNPDFAEKCGNKAKEVSETFSKTKIGKMWANIVEQKI